MDKPHINDNDEETLDDVIIDHEVNYGVPYLFECGKSFVEICVEMGIDDNDTQISL